MTRKSITTNPATITCAVCGRTLLRGEHSDVFLSAGSRRDVCELCTGRAMHEGWIREGVDDVVARGRGERRRGGSLLGRLRAARRAEAGLAPRRPLDLASGRRLAVRPIETFDDALTPNPMDLDPISAEPVSEDFFAAPEPAAVPEPVVERRAVPTPDEALYDQRSVRGVPTNAELKVARALELFNGSAHTRTVSGVSRSLGAPIVSARPSRTEGAVVTIVVAWELSWYRFEVDLGDEAAGVRIVAQGQELGELDIIDQTPNAAADEHGSLHPAASLT